MILAFLFGCMHRDLTRPFTLDGETYKVCLSCGAHIAYSTADMRPLTRSERRAKAA